MTKTKITKASDIKREWHLVDADGKILGRLASQIAKFLLGKNKPYFVSHLDCGDYVVVINASKVAVTGKKEKQKIYYRHSGYPGGFKKITLEELRKTHPLRIIEHAVLGMLPKNKLRDLRMRRLYIFANDKYPYEDKFKKEP